MYPYRIPHKRIEIEFRAILQAIEAFNQHHPSDPIQTIGYYLSIAFFPGGKKPEELQPEELQVVLRKLLDVIGVENNHQEFLERNINGEI
jgi:hypothetical protein